tara:strand:+ start:296 stop:445 length:150 start_codon:yes stop_codon:yes gene_type:complete
MTFEEINQAALDNDLPFAICPKQVKVDEQGYDDEYLRNIPKAPTHKWDF